MNTLKLRKVEVPEGKLPLLAVTVTTEEGEKIRRGFLSPFRKYCFQVSGTVNGSGDFGASEVIGLKNIKIEELGCGFGHESNHNPEGVTKELLRGQAVIALAQFAAINEASLGDIANHTGEGKKMLTYIDEVYDFLFK